MAKPCRSCTDHIEHCHGLLIAHDGWIECTEPTCPGADPVLHDDRMECTDCTIIEVSVELVA